MDILKLKPDQPVEPAPEQTGFDYGLAIAKVGAVAFPFFGAGVTLLDLITAPLRGKRSSDWCEEIRLRLNELSQKIDGLTPETLAANEAFISAFAQATQAALRTHQREKLHALRNAVVNVAAGTAPADDLHMAFFALIDRLTPSHLAVLRFFNETPWDGVQAGRPLEQAVPQVKSEVAALENVEDDFVKLLIRELYGSGLSQFNPDDFSSPKAKAGAWLTTVGRQFLEFISESDHHKARK